VTFRLAPDSSAFDFPSSNCEGQAEEHLPEGLVLQSGDGLSVVTLRGRILLWNDIAEEQLGIPRQQAVGSFLADVSRTPDTWESNWGHHLTTIGAHLSGTPPVRRVLSTRDNANRPVRVHVSSMMLQFEAQLPVIVYTHTVERIGEDELVELPPPFGLTTREWEVACLLMSGLGTSEIAGEMQIAYATVRAHIRNMLEALGASTRTQALMRLWSRYGTPDVAGFSHMRSVSRGRHK
jgi:DNA-binding CsgD family transcriptional regulator